MTVTEVARRAGRRWRWIALSTLAVFVVYQAVILMILVAGLGGRPNFVRVYPAWDNARRIVAFTPSTADVLTLLAREPLIEYGRLHPRFRVAEWSFELTWSSLLFFLSFSTLLGVYLGLAGGKTGWGAAGSIGGAGLVGLFGASVSSLTHCGLGSFGVLLAIVGVSTTTLQWFGRVEPMLIAAGYGLIVLGIMGRAARPASAERSLVR